VKLRIEVSPGSAVAARAAHAVRVCNADGSAVGAIRLLMREEHTVLVSWLPGLIY